MAETNGLYPVVCGVVFKDVVGFPGYCVGDDGSIWSRHRGEWAPMKLTLDRGGYLRVSFMKNRRNVNRAVSKIVLEAFVGPPPNGMEACHFPDRSRTNNRLGNLRWDTRTGNMADQLIHGTRSRGEKVNGSKLSKSDVASIREARSKGEQYADIALRYPVGKSEIGCICRNEVWRE